MLGRARPNNDAAAKHFLISPLDFPNQSQDSGRTIHSAVTLGLAELGRARLTSLLGGISSKPQLTASPPRAQRFISVRFRVPRLLAFDALVNRSLAIDSFLKRSEQNTIHSDRRPAK